MLHHCCRKNGFNYAEGLFCFFTNWLTENTTGMIRPVCRILVPAEKDLKWFVKLLYGLPVGYSLQDGGQ